MDWLLSFQNLGRPDSGNSGNLLFAFVHSESKSSLSPPSIVWGCIGSLDMLGYEETKSLTSLQEMVLFRSLLDLNHPWGLQAEYKKDRMLVG
jgi:hypothetical protein